MNTERPGGPLPADFQRALSRSGLEQFFAECAFIHHAGYLSWITQTRRLVTRRERIREAVRRLRDERSRLERRSGDVRPEPCGGRA